MAYISRKGKKPFEYASKSSHSNIINDSTVVSFLNQCLLPKNCQDVDFQNHFMFCPDEIKDNPIRFVIAVDGSYSEISVKKEFPSSTISFFQFGALTFSISDLEELAVKPFIDPEDIAKLKNIQRLKLSLPTKNILVKDQITLINSVRHTLYEFFNKQPDDNSFIETLRWFLFEEYSIGVSDWNLASCPICGGRNIKLSKLEIDKDYSFRCHICKEKIYLTDVFRLKN